MKNVEGQEPNGTVAGRVFSLEERAWGSRKGDFDGGIIGVEKTEAGQGGFEGLGGVFPMDKTGVAQKMDVDERQQDDQAEASADLFPRLRSHQTFILPFRRLPVNPDLSFASGRAVKGVYGMKGTLLSVANRRCRRTPAGLRRL
jgi:hypothetical protein